MVANHFPLLLVLTWSWPLAALASSDEFDLPLGPIGSPAITLAGSHWSHFTNRTVLKKQFEVIASRKVSNLYAMASHDYGMLDRGTTFSATRIVNEICPKLQKLYAKSQAQARVETHGSTEPVCRVEFMNGTERTVQYVLVSQPETLQASALYYYHYLHFMVPGGARTLADSEMAGALKAIHPGRRPQ